MKLDANRLALAFAAATALLWVVCSALVAMAPDTMLTMSEHMVHGKVDNFVWTLTWTGFLLGLVCWVLWAGAAGWLIGRLYNLLAKSVTR